MGRRRTLEAADQKTLSPAPMNTFAPQIRKNESGNNKSQELSRRGAGEVGIAPLFSSLDHVKLFLGGEILLVSKIF